VWPPRSSLVLGVLVLAAVVSTRWVRLNLSPSVPLGLYRLTPVPPALTRGMLVLTPVPASVQPWLSPWRPLLKPIAGLPDDRACNVEEALVIEGVPYGPIYRDAHGRALPAWQGCRTVGPGEVLLASKEPRSLDGRYFGMTSIRDLTAQAVPLWIWR
jgi:type IV secretory pathway protease TraF